MADIPRRPLIDDALAEAERHLDAATPSAAIRELRVRHGMLSRVVRGWDHVPPHDAQTAAMLECALDLCALVRRVCSVPVDSTAFRRTSRPAVPHAAHARPAHARTTRPPPRRDASMRTTRPPPRRSGDAPPSSRRG